VGRYRVAPNDAAAVQIVLGERHADPIAGHDANTMLHESASDEGQQLVASVIEADADTASIYSSDDTFGGRLGFHW
jgi:hypothetical protein